MRYRAPFAALALCIGLAASAGATITAPPLVIERAEAVRTASATWVRIEGTFPGSDLVQLDYPLQVLVRDVREEGRFVWLTLPDGAQRGSLGEDVGSGPTAGVLAAIDAAGRPDPGSHVARIGPRHLELQLGPAFDAREAEAFLFVVYEGEPVFSNALRFPVTVVAP